MDSRKLQDWLQIVGMFSVVASLIFVGLQMKQDREIALAGRYQERASLAMDYWNANLMDEILTTSNGERLLLIPQLTSTLDEEITARELGARYNNARRIMVAYDNHHFQYISGFYDEESWVGFRGQMDEYIARTPLAQYLCKFEGHKYRVSFAELCLQIISDSVATSAK